MNEINPLYQEIDLIIKRFYCAASSDYEKAPCWLILPSGSIPPHIRAIAIPDSLYCLSNDLQDAHSIILKHTHIVNHLYKTCSIKKQYAYKFWLLASREIVKQKNLLSSFTILSTLHSEYFQLSMIDRNIGIYEK